MIVVSMTSWTKRITYVNRLLKVLQLFNKFIENHLIRCEGFSEKDVED